MYIIELTNFFARKLKALDDKWYLGDGAFSAILLYPSLLKVTRSWEVMRPPVDGDIQPTPVQDGRAQTPDWLLRSRDVLDHLEGCSRATSTAIGNHLTNANPAVWRDTRAHPSNAWRLSGLVRKGATFWADACTFQRSPRWSKQKTQLLDKPRNACCS